MTECECVDSPVEVEISGDVVSYRCSECGAEWSEVFVLVPIDAPRMGEEQT